MKLSAADLLVIVDTLDHSRCVLNYGSFTKEARERCLDKVVAILEQIEIEVLPTKPEPVTICGDTGV